MTLVAVAIPFQVATEAETDFWPKLKLKPKFRSVTNLFVVVGIRPAREEALIFICDVLVARVNAFVGSIINFFIQK